jgi:hypothetical protein
MKKNLLFLSILISVFSIVSCGPSPKEAAEYNDKIVNTQAHIVQKLDSLDAVMATYDSKKIDLSIKSTKKTVDAGIESVTKLGDFDGKSDFKNAAVKYFKTVKSVLDSEYTAINKVIMIPDSMYGPKEEDIFNKMKESYEKRLSESLQEFAGVQQDFAKSYNVEIH